MRIIRLESTLNSNLNLYNKIILFDQIESSIRVIEITPTIINNFEEAEKLINNLQLYKEDTRIIINKIIKDSYSFPFKLFLDITDKCQLNCKHCLTKQLNLHNQLSMNQINAIVEECKNHGAFLVKLGGGEPLLHPNIKKIISMFYDIGMHISLSTNGYKIDENMARFLKEKNVKVSISLEGPQELNDYIRGKGHYNVALKALKILKHANANCLIRVTLTREMLDLDKIQELINLARQYNVKLKISYCRPAGSAIDNELLIRYDDFSKYQNVISYINRTEFDDVIIMDEGMQLKQDPELSKFLYNDRICGAANRSIHINSSGKISPCVFLGEEYIESNSCYKNGDILDYWSEKKGSKLRIIRNISMPATCSNCERLCKYECLSTRLYFNDRFDLNDPNCLGGFERCRKQK